MLSEMRQQTNQATKKYFAMTTDNGNDFRYLSEDNITVFDHFSKHILKITEEDKKMFRIQPALKFLPQTTSHKMG